MTSTSMHFLEQVESVDQKINCCIKEVSKLLQNVDSLGETFKSHAFDDKQVKSLGSLLNDLVSSIHTSRGIEDFIIPHMGELRSQTSLSLIPALCKTCQCDAENISKLNYLEQNSHLWEKLCFHLEDYLFKKLSSTADHNVPPEGIANWLLLQNYIDLLKSIHTPSTVWEVYKRFRSAILVQYNCTCVAGFTACFCCFVNFCIHSICEDMMLIHTGHFHPFVVTWSNVLHTYIEAIELNLFDVLNALEQWIKVKGPLPPVLIPFVSANFPWRKTKHFKTCITCWTEEGIAQESLITLKKLAELMSNGNFSSQWHEVCDSAYTLIVLRIVAILYSFQFHLSAVFSNSLNSKEMFHKHPVDLPFLSEGMSFTLPMDSPDPSPLHQPHPAPEDEAIIGTWNWRTVIAERGYLTHLQRMLQKGVQTVICDSIKEEWQWLLENEWDSTNSSVVNKIPSCCEQSSVVFSSTVQAVREIEKFMPVMIASEGPLCPFKSSFSHTINSYFFDLTKHIQSIANEVPTKFSIYCLYVCTSSALFLRDRVLKYNTLVSENSEETGSSLNNVCHAVTQLADNLTENIFLLHVKYVSCGLLLDPGSHDWQNLKPFYEGERVSYSVQMWNFYLRGLLNDLQYYLPQQVAQELYTRILSDSLTQMLLHYSHVSSSETRVNQLQADIITILLCTSEILFPACTSVAEVIGKISQGNKSGSLSSLVNKIHSNCCTLLCTMAVLTSPVSELYKVFKNGFPHTSLSLRTKYDFVSPWLPWIRATLFPESGRGPLMSNVAVWLAVKICTSWFQPNPVAILKAFTVHHCTLSILLITQATYIPDDISDVIKGNNNALTENRDPKLQLAKSVYQLLLCMSDHSNYLADVLLPVIERTDGWKEFDQSAFNRDFTQRPWWYLGLLYQMKPYIESVIQASIPSVIQRQKLLINSPVSDQWKSLKDKLAGCISCTCEDDVNGSILDETTWQLQCILEILSSLDNYLTTLPLPLQCCLSSLDCQLLNYVHDSEPAQRSLPLQVLLSTICIYLKDIELMKLCVGHPFSHECRLMCSMISDTLESIALGSQLISALPTPFSAMIAKQFHHIKQHFDDLRNEPDGTCSVKDNEELEDETLNLAAVELTQQPNGDETIFYLQMLLCCNSSWIQISLGVPDMLSPDSVVSPISPTPLSEQGSSETPDFYNDNTFSANSKRTLLRQEMKSAATCSLEEIYDSQKTPVRYDDNQRQNVDTLIGKMQWNEMNSTQVTSQHSLNLDLDLTSFVYSSTFNPFEYFESLGDSQFNEKSSMEFPISWEALLSHLPVLGLTETGFCSLLSQRWEIRNENFLSSDDKGCIQEIKLKYKLCDSTSCSTT